MIVVEMFGNGVMTLQYQYIYQKKELISMMKVRKIDVCVGVHGTPTTVITVSPVVIIVDFPILTTILASVW